MIARIEAKVKVYITSIIFPSVRRRSLVLENALRVKARLGVAATTTLGRPGKSLVLIEAVGASDVLVGLECCCVAATTFVATLAHAISVVSLGSACDIGVLELRLGASITWLVRVVLVPMALVSIEGLSVGCWAGGLATRVGGTAAVHCDEGDGG